jgi:hypothetical protein
MRVCGPVAVSIVALILGCSSGGGTNQLPPTGNGSGTGSGGGGGSGQGSGGGGGMNNADSGTSGQGGSGSGSGLQNGDDCDPPNSNACAQGLLCCPVGGNPREGGIFNSCMMAQGSPPACP